MPGGGQLPFRSSMDIKASRTLTSKTPSGAGGTYFPSPPSIQYSENPQPPAQFPGRISSQYPLTNDYYGSNPQLGSGNPNFNPPNQQIGCSFPLRTHPDAIGSFQMVDLNRDGFIEVEELQQAISLRFGKFSFGTCRLLVFLFTRSCDSSSGIGPKEFAEIWELIVHWRGIFERYDRDGSGKIECIELRDALLGVGCRLPESVLRVLISRYEDGSGLGGGGLSFGHFMECGIVVKGLTDKFKEKDGGLTGSATLSYYEFLLMAIPFVVSD